MNSHIRSALTFEGYVVKYIEFKINNVFDVSKDFVNEVPSIIPEVEKDASRMRVNLVTKIFENCENNNFPFEMKIEVEGSFKFNEETDIDFTPNAIAILFPYIRAIITNYTAQANIPPYILPAINVNKLIEVKKH